MKLFAFSKIFLDNNIKIYNNLPISNEILKNLDSQTDIVTFLNN
jgi:hypothetical protein